MLIRYRHRRWIALLALFALLFQQAAMAGYRCPLETSQAAATALMKMADCEQAAAGDKARCEQHCSPQTASSDHAQQPTVPPALLPPTTWLRAAAWRPSLFAAAPACEVTARSAAPPISIRHCTFQI